MPRCASISCFHGLTNEFLVATPLVLAVLLRVSDLRVGLAMPLYKLKAPNK